MPRVSKTPRTRINGSGFSHAKTVDAEDVDDSDDDQKPPAADDAPIGPQPADNLSEMMAGLAGASQAKITVYRIVKNQQPAYVFECDPSSFSLDDLRDKYNGGEFRLYVSKNGQLWRNMRVFVEPRQTSGHHEPPAPSTQMGEILSVMRDGFAQQAQAIRDTSANRVGIGGMFQGADIPAIISAAAAAITALRPPMPPPAAESSVDKALDMFMRGMEIANGMRDSAPGDSSIGGMLREVLKSPVMAAAVQQMATPPQVPQQRLPNPQAISHAKTPQPPAPPAPQQPQETDMLAYYLGFLSSKAANGADAELYAELVLDNLSDEQLDTLLAQGDSLIDHFVTLCPAVGNHREWFAKLIASVRSAMTDEPDDSQPGVINATDATATVVPGNPS